MVLSTLLLIFKKNLTYYSWELMCSPRWNVQPESLIALIVCYLLPCTTMVLCNISIILFVKKLNSVAPLRHPETGQFENSPNVKNIINTRRSLYLLVIVYLFFVAPYYTAKFSYLIRENGLESKSMHVFYTLLMFLTSALNPLIYAILRKDHRRAMFKVLEMAREKYKMFKKAAKKNLEKLNLCCEKRG